jgi:sigma-B regulation protein RsbU (phosphoserine phosphatase)
VLDLEHELAARNHRLAEANQQLREAYQLIERDLMAAAEVQRNMLPRPGAIGRLGFDWLFLPSSHVGGDTFSVMRRDGQVIFYQIDVAGHGVQAALLSVSLQRLLSGPGMDLAGGEAGAAGLWADPPRVVGELNRRFQADDIDDATYFTILYGVLDLASGAVTLTQAGHPSPLLIGGDGAATRLGGGGFVVGLLPDMEYDRVELTLAPGERLVLYSDGMVDCRNGQGEPFSEERLAQAMADARGHPLPVAVQGLGERLRAWTDGVAFDDDVSVLVLELGPEAEPEPGA